MVTLFTSSPALTVFFVFFVVVVCLVLFSLVSVAFLANKDVYKKSRKVHIIVPNKLGLS